MIPPSAKEAIIAKAATTAAIPAAIAARFAGNGSEAPDAVALAIAPASFTPILPNSDVFSAVSLANFVYVLAVSTVVFVVLIAISALSAAIFLALDASAISPNIFIISFMDS
jgi:hypothetical protein